MDAKVEIEPRARRVTLPTRGGEMAFLDFGPAERPVDVIFSHANGFNARTYRTILGPLAAELRIFAIDLRGHGATTIPAVVEGRHGWLEFRDDLLAFLAEAAEGPVVLAGHSMGGTTSLLAAAEQPAAVKALALFDPVIMSPEMLRARSEDVAAIAESPLVQGALRRRAAFPSKAAAREAYLGRGAFKSWRPEQVADYVEAGFRETPGGEVTLTCAPEWEASNFRMHNYDPWTAFKTSRCPIRILKAAQGSTAMLDGRDADLTGDGRITIATVPNTTHFLPMERPDVVRETLRGLSTP